MFSSFVLTPAPPTRGLCSAVVYDGIGKSYRRGDSEQVNIII